MSRRRAFTRVGALACIAALAGGVLAAVPADASRSSAPPRICNGEIAAATQWGTDISRLGEEGVLILDGRTIDLRGEYADWRLLDRVDQSFANRFHSLSWLVLALGSTVDVVDLAVQRDIAAPDPTTRRGADALRSTGWTEGIIRLRMGTISCLYAATGDERLMPIMDRLVAANLDPYRYRGAPLNKVHNHGTLANLSLLEAARVFDRPEWREPAVRRFERDAASVFAPCGMSAEQSSSYHLLHVNLWRRSLLALGAEVDFGIDMGAAVRQAALATWQLTRPDGQLEAIGSGKPTSLTAAGLGLTDPGNGLPAVESLPTRLWCPDLGWASNRSSWSPDASHYVLRFGPRRAFHGHQDRGAITWFAQGVPVFSDRGVYDRARGSRWQWAQSAEAHSTFDGLGTPWRRPFTAEYARVGDADTYRVRAAYPDGVSLQRDFTIPLVTDDTEATLHVADTGRSPTKRQWHQRWQLAEGWQPFDRTTAWEPAAFHPGKGIYLYGSCASRDYMLNSIRTVETFPGWRQVATAYALECAGRAKVVSLETLWVVSPVEGLLSWDRKTGEYAVAPPAPEPPPEPLPEPLPAP
jgi:hypothetical protein